MNWKAMALLVVAWSIYAPFAAGGSVCHAPSCCAHMQACCGECPCAPKQTCQVTKPMTIDQQTLVRSAQLSPRVEVELFTVGAVRPWAPTTDGGKLSWTPERSPMDTSQKPQALLCLWLI